MPSVQFPPMLQSPPAGSPSEVLTQMLAPTLVVISTGVAETGLEPLPAVASISICIRPLLKPPA